MFFGMSTRAESAEDLGGQPVTAKVREGAGKYQRPATRAPRERKKPSATTVTRPRSLEGHVNPTRAPRTSREASEPVLNPANLCRDVAPTRTTTSRGKVGVGPFGGVGTVPALTPDRWPGRPVTDREESSRAIFDVKNPKKVGARFGGRELRLRTDSGSATVRGFGLPSPRTPGGIPAGSGPRDAHLRMASPGPAPRSALRREGGDGTEPGTRGGAACRIRASSGVVSAGARRPRRTLKGNQAQEGQDLSQRWQRRGGVRTRLRSKASKVERVARAAGRTPGRQRPR